MSRRVAVTILASREEIEAQAGDLGPLTYKPAPGDRGTEVYSDDEDAKGALRDLKRLVEIGEVPRSAGQVSPAQPEAANA